MGTETIKSISEPWSQQAPHLRRTMNRATDLYQQGPLDYYPGQTVSNFSNPTRNAMDMYRQNAYQNTGQANALNQQMTGTLGGDYLNSNPYLDRMMDSASRGMTRAFREGTAPSIGAQFDSAGRYGSGLYQNMQGTAQDELARGLGETAGNIYGQNYANERSNQMRAAALAPSTIPMNDYAASQLLNVGNMQDAQQQRNINAQRDRWDFNQNRGWDNLARYGSAVSGQYGGMTSQQRPYSDNSTNAILGGAALGGAGGQWLGNQFGFGGKLGGAAGAALGGLGGWIFG